MAPRTGWLLLLELVARETFVLFWNIIKSLLRAVLTFFSTTTIGNRGFNFLVIISNVCNFIVTKPVS